jgi:hypothetical protein
MSKLEYNKKRFKNYAEYQAFLDAAMKSLFIKIDANIDVFKRLKDR